MKRNKIGIREQLPFRVWYELRWNRKRSMDITSKTICIYNEFQLMLPLDEGFFFKFDCVVSKKELHHSINSIAIKSTRWRRTRNRSRGRRSHFICRHFEGNRSHWTQRKTAQRTSDWHREIVCTRTVKNSKNLTILTLTMDFVNYCLNWIITKIVYLYTYRGKYLL